MSPDNSSDQHTALTSKSINDVAQQTLSQPPVGSPVDPPAYTPAFTGQKRPRINLIASTATTCSIILCYGTLMLINLLGQMGFDITVNETLWAGAITFASLLAILGLLANLYRHKHVLPVVMGGLGCGLVNYVMHFDYYLTLELLGFACLCCAAMLDWRALTK